MSAAVPWPQDTGPVAPGVVVTLWRGGRGGMLAAAKADSIKLAGLPLAGVQLHSDAEGVARDLVEAAEAARRTLGRGLRLWVGLGCDGALRRALASPSAWRSEIALFGRARDAASSVGAELTVCDPEGAYKLPGSRDAAFAREVLDVLHRTGAPPLGFSSFDHPGFHGEYEWEAWEGAQSPVVLDLSQYYLEAKAPPPPGTLGQRVVNARASQAAMVRAGRIRADLARGGYYEGHGVHAYDTATALAETKLACLWPPLDQGGLAGLKVGLELRTAGAGAGCVARYQAAHGLTADGILGPRTWAAAGGVP